MAASASTASHRTGNCLVPELLQSVTNTDTAGVRSGFKVACGSFKKVQARCPPPCVSVCLANMHTLCPVRLEAEDSRFDIIATTTRSAKGLTRARRTMKAAYIITQSHQCFQCSQWIPFRMQHSNSIAEHGSMDSLSHAVYSIAEHGSLVIPGTPGACNGTCPTPLLDNGVALALNRTRSYTLQCEDNYYLQGSPLFTCRCQEGIGENVWEGSGSCVPMPHMCSAPPVLPFGFLNSCSTSYAYTLADQSSRTTRTLGCRSASPSTTLWVKMQATSRWCARTVTSCRLRRGKMRSSLGRAVGIRHSVWLQCGKWLLRRGRPLCEDL